MRARLIGASLILVGLFVPSAEAQTGSPWTVGGIGGVGRTWDDESQIGMGVLLGGRVDGRLAGGLRLEGAVDWLQHDRSDGFFQSEGHTTLVGAALKYAFGGENSYGYVLGGPVIAFHSGTTTFDGMSRDVSSRDPGLSFGGGFAGSAGRVEIGPEARFVILWADDGSAPSYAIYGGVRIALKR